MAVSLPLSCCCFVRRSDWYPCWLTFHGCGLCPALIPACHASCVQCLSVLQASLMSTYRCVCYLFCPQNALRLRNQIAAQERKIVNLETQVEHAREVADEAQASGHAALTRYFFLVIPVWPFRFSIHINLSFCLGSLVVRFEYVQGGLIEMAFSFIVAPAISGGGRAPQDHAGGVPTPYRGRVCGHVR